ncbi:T9SS type A sorting domain-containing protein [Chryseobacterium sediminis]|uniref:T9SS type A sorting domain-containing protein n=1 Tax=Chryseobacterium sediminis TaxID=1679494 RepID=UPI002859DB8C|nr:T9SS type A sorting domain-containing protein [Chryseobacterium sediminis]MDR6464559.1 hypothetical protein [Chryseobacterium sediminis]
MKKILTEIFRSSESFLRARTAGFLLAAAVFCSTVLSAQFVPVNPSGTKVNVKRQDSSPSSSIPGYVPSSVSLEFKTGTISETRSFPEGQISNQNYTLPDIFTTVGQPPIMHTFKVYFPNPGLTSRYYPIPTAIGGSTTIIPGCWSPEMDRGLFYYISPNGGYGYGVTLTRTASTEYLLQCTKFLCYICDPCPPVIPTVSKSKTTEQSKAKLYPNPSSGFSELEYTASGKETITVMVMDITGKTVYGYKTDIASGLNKMPIDIQNAVAGTYYVNWRSSNGNTGSLQLIKK